MSSATDNSVCLPDLGVLLSDKTDKLLPVSDKPEPTSVTTTAPQNRGYSIFGRIDQTSQYETIRYLTPSPYYKFIGTNSGILSQEEADKFYIKPEDRVKIEIPYSDLNSVPGHPIPNMNDLALPIIQSIPNDRSKLEQCIKKVSNIISCEHLILKSIRLTELPSEYNYKLAYRGQNIMTSRYSDEFKCQIFDFSWSSKALTQLRQFYLDQKLEATRWMPPSMQPPSPPINDDLPEGTMRFKDNLTIIFPKSGIVRKTETNLPESNHIHAYNFSEFEDVYRIDLVDLQDMVHNYELYKTSYLFCANFLTELISLQMPIAHDVKIRINGKVVLVTDVNFCLILRTIDPYNEYPGCQNSHLPHLERKVLNLNRIETFEIISNVQPEVDFKIHYNTFRYMDGLSGYAFVE